MFDINDLLDKILIEFNNPLYCRQLDDTRIDIYYIALNKNYYIVLNGVCGECDNIAFYHNNNISCDITTEFGINIFTNKTHEHELSNFLFNIQLNTFDENDNKLMLQLKKLIRQHLHP